MFVLLIKVLLLQPTIFPMFKFELLGSMYMPVPAEKCIFDNASSKTLWYLSILELIEWSSFIRALILLLKNCWVSTADTELSTILDLA